MKPGLKKTLVQIINNELVWFFLKPVAKFGFFATYHKLDRPLTTLKAGDPYINILNKKEVLHGPFRGMKYPSLSSFGSTLYPKLIGSYERELHETIKELSSENYTEIIDIGCAEGYYAIGLGLKFGHAKVYAYDTDKTARDLCAEMAKVNAIEDRITIEGACTAKDLEKFKFTGKGLIICDCEGYEDFLFDDQNVHNLSGCDLVIETHDFIDINISTNLVKLFSNTHTIQTIKSIDDIEKAKTYAYEETKGLSLEEKKTLYREWRPAIMEWLICKPKALQKIN